MLRLFLTVALLVTFLLDCGSSYAFDLLGRPGGETEGDQFGTALCTVDFDGDGFTDLVASSSAADDAGPSSGKVYVYLGGPSADLVADYILIGVESSFFGNSLGSAGDFNKDGYTDLIVGAPFHDQPAQNAGAAFLYYCGPSPDTAVDLIFTGEAQNDYFGTSVSSAGDFNGDLADDIVIGAYKADYGTYDDPGKAYIYYGGTSPDATVDKIIVGEADGERFGFSATGLDFNGDSFSDIAVGAYSYDDIVLNQGRIYVFYGSASPDTLFDLTVTGTSAGHKFGHSLATGLVGDDSYKDLIMGTDGYSVSGNATGKIYVYYGGPGADANADYEYSLERTQADYLGFAVTSGADFDGNGSDEILAGMPGNDDAATDAGGAVYLKGGNPPVADTAFLGVATNEEMGKSVCLWDGYGDLQTTVVAIGAPRYDNYRGRVHLFSQTTPVPNQPPDLDPIGNKFIMPEELLSFEVTAIDPDLDSVTISAENLPTGSSFNYEGWDSGLGKYKGAFSWTPEIGQEGVYQDVRFIADDGESTSDESIKISVGTYVCGDADASGYVDIDDVVYVISYIFAEGPEPLPYASANADCSVDVDIDDVVYLITYIFASGPEPCDPDGNGTPEC
jgi:hypothetical protein